MSSAAHNPATIIDTLYRAHHGWLTAWLKKKMACPHHAADLSHDTFIRLLSQPDLPVLKEPRAYLLVTANRLMINLNRKRRVEEETLHSMAVLISGQSSQDAAHVSAIRQLLERVLFMLLEELDERTRKAFLMSRVDGMTYTEIAYVMNVSENRIKQYLVKALAYCHQRLYQFKAELHG
ncbi:MAG: sigma-70 family RNA polymerase sigma factor [Nitrosomonas sp.]|uniref:sigma-70 family RNA polymerase sigma factor n=1 Tax=Nitrosomonas sp. TaxID=42353 RepID=UPI001D731D09|nr:sigma-70 family RNA polymerase sigma factor [Nitrosomonas sp.]MBX3631154.1 sigma-70 family RNA polymerase sigma factor [Nitrosomonas sp.]MCP5292674.1 sigma-70 family RNA polymerase sigma factor [Burkholderiales bacterium]MCW5609006.1 sigma-70 family RNA polymerase sigma factor [Nitrosomonas sp.]MDR4515772.1 sigma-70 family RNA polymerase sigma factor [Nitrosomonas sp.]